MSFGFYAFWFVNLAEIVLCLWDKFCARTHRWRVPERVFFTLAFLGGALGLGARDVDRPSQGLQAFVCPDCGFSRN